MAQDTWIPLTSGLREIASYQRQLNLATSDAAFQALASGLAASCTWQNLPPSRLLLRLGDHPALALCGSFTEDHTPALANCVSALRHSLANLLWVDWHGARLACEDLAGRLFDCLGRDLEAARFEAIPRGGYLVLGMLAQALDLAPHQLGSGPTPEDSPLVVVDDCSLSGARFAEFLRRCEAQRVIFAHLASHRDLRKAVLAREPRVEACLAALDLEEPTTRESDPEASRRRQTWARRLGSEGRYWLGQPQHICFPWNEPDRPVWDPVTERTFPGWRILPRELCLKRRAGTPELPFQAFQEPGGAVRLPAGVMYFEELGAVGVANLITGASVRLEGTAASFWRALLAAADLEEATHRLCEEYEVERATCRRDLERSLQALEDQGLLCRAEGPS